MSSHPVHNICTRHIGVRYHYVQDAVAAGTIRIERVPTLRNTADTLTKALPTPRFVECRDELGVIRVDLNVVVMGGFVIHLDEAVAHVAAVAAVARAGIFLFLFFFLRPSEGRTAVRRKDGRQKEGRAGGGRWRCAGSGRFCFMKRYGGHWRC
ncbi:MAG: hypothetical protein BJ554DRAFT_1038 [Olpidium bornovanus]|uniref:Uncharacterized protein n=1 Tax=Olpidium bornovanus TaxID=278681 RepID=A0A8H8DLW4_9FUNG|nr:MAG: hypothetical protein BJ554DRAFT_1038 [Olpidium bornovanus]